VLVAWEVDYNTMMEQMIYEQNPPSFDQLMEDLKGAKF
jgi:hypothetical protein